MGFKEEGCTKTKKEQKGDYEEKGRHTKTTIRQYFRY